MLGDKRIIEQHNMDSINLVKKLFPINNLQELKLQKFIDELAHYNKHTNLVGKSTLEDPWKSHILDSIQISSYMSNKNCSILDMGTGAGFPGLILAIIGYGKVSLVDSNGKKIKFINYVCKKLDIDANIFLNRIEKLRRIQYDFLTSRALTKLNKLLIYSQSFIGKDTVLIFLKGNSVNEEILEAKKNWNFKYDVHQSYSDERGKVLIIKNLIVNK